MTDALGFYTLSYMPVAALGAAIAAVVAALVFIHFAGARRSCRALRRKLDEQTMLLDNVQTQIWYLIDPRTYGAVNAAHARFLGVEKDSLDRRGILEVADSRVAGVCLDGNEEAFHGKKQVRREVRTTAPDGSPCWLSVVKTPKLDDRANVQYVFCTAEDITARKDAEAELRMQTSAINAASDQVMITDRRGLIEFCNPAFEQETGYSAAEVVGKNPRFLKSGKQDSAFYALMWNTILKGRTWHGELTNRRKDGSLYVTQMTITPVKNEAGDVERFVAVNRDITEKKLFEQRLDYLAHHDPLTGLPNRLLIGHKLKQSLARASRSGGKLAVLFLDLDGFKLVNDTLGHGTGDLLLTAAAERLKCCLREGDMLARMGGDEFIVALPDIGSAEDAVRSARRVLKAFSGAFDLEGHEAFITTSIGISLYPEHGGDVETLVKNADTAMYRAKELGRNGYYVYDQALNTVTAERMALENSLRRAIERGEFVTYYQPRVEIQSGRIVGAEALVRWLSPDMGLMMPDQFLPLAEDTGLIVPISEWVLRQACAQNKAWQDAGLPAIDMAVNVSARQFQRRGTLAALRKALKESELDPRRLELEITESALMGRPEMTEEMLRKMKAMGVRISVDDFGTGYCSLSYLKRFSVDALKIDRSFVADITTNPDDAAITRAVVAMAKSLNLKIVAEGVETLEQLRFLWDLRCDEMQGYFVSAPVPPERFEELLAASCSARGQDVGLAA